MVKCFAVNASCNHCLEDSDCSDFCENKYEQPKCADQGYYGSNFRCCVCKGEQQSYYFSVRISSLFLFIHFCDVFVSLSVIFLFFFYCLVHIEAKKFNDLYDLKIIFLFLFFRRWVVAVGGVNGGRGGG